MKSLLYLSAVLASFFLLFVSGAAAGGLLLSPAGALPALFGAATGAVCGLCGWFKLVGYFVALEDAHLSRCETPATRRADAADVGPSLAARDVRAGNHLMASGLVTFISALFSSPEIALVVGTVGVLSIAAGFGISITGVEFPSEEGIWRRVKLMTGRSRVG